MEEGILYKRRGIGMFVAEGAVERIRAKRREEFMEQYVKPLAAEARKLGPDGRRTAGDAFGRLPTGGLRMDGKTLQAQGLCKTYGKTRALDGVTLTLEPGHIYGLIGRNGAGKTTLLAALTASCRWIRAP